MLQIVLLILAASLPLQASDTFITDVHLDVQLDCKPNDPNCDICNLCKNNALCQKVNGTSAICYCVPGFTGTYCQININECLSHPCRNNATCIDGINSYRCECSPHYKGTHCEIALTACDLSPCQNNAKCLIENPSEPLKHRCICAPGFTGQDCSSEINECISSPCRNSAKCEDVHLGYRCHCPPGFNGTNCEININECIDNRCENGAKCIDLIDGYQCNCAPGFSGLRCEIRLSACEQPVGPCLNNGKCHAVNNSIEYLCECSKGYTGVNCESDLDECASHPCANGARCVDLIDGYRCECLNGFSGLNCESNVNECVEFSGVCPNNTRCIDLDPSANALKWGYKCDCSLLNSLSGANSKFVGQNCTSRLDICENDFVRAKCKNNAICEPIWSEDKGEQEFKCKCLNGYAGKYCEFLTIIKLDASYHLNYDVNSAGGVVVSGGPFDSILSEFNLKFDFKLSAWYFQNLKKRVSLPLVTLFLNNNIVIDLVIQNYVIKITKYEPSRLLGGAFYGNNSRDLSVTESSLPFLNFNMSSHATKWHSIEIYIKFNLIQIVYFYENYYFDTVIQIKQMPPVLKKNTKIFNSFKIGKPFRYNSDNDNDEEEFLEACIRNLKLNDNFLFLNDQNVKYGCDSIGSSNECEKNKCKNNAKCVASLFDYACECPPMFYGKNCENKANDMKFRFNRSRLLLSFDKPLQEISLKFSFAIHSMRNTVEKTFVDLIQIHSQSDLFTIGLQEFNQSSRLFFKHFSNSTSGNDTNFKIDELNKESFNQNQFYSIELSIRNGSLFINLDRKTQIKLHFALNYASAFNKVTISPNRQFFGAISGLFYLNDQIINPIQSYSNIQITSECLYDDCEEECMEYASPKCNLISNDAKAQTNLIHEFTLHRSNALKSISFDIDFSQFDKNPTSSNQLLLSLIVNNNYRLISVLYKVSSSNKYLIFNNKSINVPYDHSSHPKLDRLKIQLKSTTIDFKINNMLYYATSLPSQRFLLASGLNTTDFESYSLNIGNQCIQNLKINDQELPLNNFNNASSSIFDAYSLINNNCKDFNKNIFEFSVPNPKAQSKQNNNEFKYLCNQMKICDAFNNKSSHLNSICLNELIYDISTFSDYQFNYAYQCGCMVKESGEILNERECIRTKEALEYNVCSSPYICLNNGVCEPDAREDFKCKCERYFTGKRCELFDPCLDNQCSVNSKCVALNQTYSCECHDGFVGKYCQLNVNDTCLNENICSLNGKCIDRFDAENYLLAYDCLCYPGFLGNNCENKLDKCVYQRPCKNGATCLNTDDGYKCECASGWTGVNCDEDVNECESIETNKCKNGSKCINTISSFKCECDESSFGDLCQYEHTCKSKPCGRGSCKVRGALDENLYDCECDAGFVGHNCTIETCELVPCLNEGICVDGNGTKNFECICDSRRFSGERCQFNVTTTTIASSSVTTSSKIAVVTSVYNGTTVGGDLNATELFKFQLDLQEQKQFSEFNMKKPRREYMYHYVLWPLLGLMIGLLLILLVTFLSKVKKSRATRGTYSPSRHEQHTSRLEFNLDLKRPPEERLI